MIHKVLLALVVAIVSTFGGQSPVNAHGAVVGRDTCVLYVGPYQMKFTGYQPNSKGNKSYCDDVPETGLTVIVLDYIDNALRPMEVGMKFVTNINITGAPEKDGETVFDLPAKIYSNGTIRIDHDFPEGGYFVGIINVKSAEGSVYTARFPFGVNKVSFMNNLLFSNIGGLLMILSVSIGGVSVAAVMFGRRTSKYPQGG